MDEEKTLPKLHILVVDDHPANRLLLTQQLIYLGQRVESAVEGTSALTLWRQHAFDLVITDCNMPGMDGYTLTQTIRQEESRQAITPCTVLGFTANALPEQYERCLQAGMDGCLFKPVELETITKAVANIEPRRVTEIINTSAFDISGLEKMTGGNRSLTTKLLKEMHSSTSEDLATLTLLLDNIDTEECKNLAHRVKGAAKIIKANHLFDCCESLEEACQYQDMSLARHCLHRLAEAMEDLMNAIAAETSEK